MRPFQTKEDFIKKSIETHGSKYDYTLTEYTGSSSKVDIKCNTCQKFFSQLPYNHYGAKRGCPHCYRIKSRKIQQSTIQEFVKSSRLVHEMQYDYSNVLYINNRTKINIKCNSCNDSFLQRPSNHLAGNGCPYCFYKSFVSKPEIEFLNFLKIKNRQFEINEYVVDGIIDNTIYEFLGDYWHGNPKKFKSTDINKHLNKTFGQLYQHTLARFDKLKNNGYNIKYVWESDWKSYKKNPIELNVRCFVENKEL